VRPPKETHTSSPPRCAMQGVLIGYHLHDHGQPQPRDIVSHYFVLKTYGGGWTNKVSMGKKEKRRRKKKSARDRGGFMQRDLRRNKKGPTLKPGRGNAREASGECFVELTVLTVCLTVEKRRLGFREIGIIVSLEGAPCGYDGRANYSPLSWRTVGGQGG
jgi:hypothetical protein